MKGTGSGIITDMVVRLLGAFIGGFISSLFGFGGIGKHGLVMSILIAVLDALILTFILRLVISNRSTAI